MSAAQRPPVPAPPVQQLGGSVLMQGAAVRDLVYALSRAIAAAQREGQHRHVPRLEAHRRIALQAFDFQTSPGGHGDVANTVELRQSYVDERDWISTADAAALGKLSRRHCQRIASELAHVGGARRVGVSWLLDRVAFVAYLTERTERLDDNAA